MGNAATCECERRAPAGEDSDRGPAGRPAELEESGGEVPRTRTSFSSLSSSPHRLPCGSKTLPCPAELQELSARGGSRAGGCTLPSSPPSSRPSSASPPGFGGLTLPRSPHDNPFRVSWYNHGAVLPAFDIFPEDDMVTSPCARSRVPTFLDSPRGSWETGNRTSMSPHRRQPANNESENSGYSMVTQNRLSQNLAPRTTVWKAKVDELSGRGVALKSILEFHLEVFELMPHFDAARSSTRDVVRCAIIPATRGDSQDHPSCALATKLNAGERRAPNKMITHHWANLWTHTIAAVVADAFDCPTYGHIAEELKSKDSTRAWMRRAHEGGLDEVTYWLCPFSVNQHQSICAGFAEGAEPEKDTVLDTVYELCSCGLPKHFDGDECEMNKFSEMMYKLGRNNGRFGHVIVVDSNFDVFGRAWCVAELAQGKRDGLEQTLKIADLGVVKKHREKLKTLDVRNCLASREEDREFILACIHDIDTLNLALRKLLLEPKKGLLEKWNSSLESLPRRLMEWQAFSPSFHNHLSRHYVEGRLQKWLLPAILLLPIAMTLAMLMLPFARPDEGLKANVAHIVAAVPSLQWLVFLLVPQWLRMVLVMDLPLRCTFYLPTVCAALTSGLLALLSVAFDVYPVPFTPVVGYVMYFVFIPVLWLLLPCEFRNERGSCSRFVHAVMVQSLLTGLLSVCYPALATIWQMRVARSCTKALVTIMFLVLRMVYERACCWMVAGGRNSANIVPSVVFSAEILYNLAVCSYIVGRSNECFGALVAVGVFANAYYLYCFTIQQPGVLPARPPTPGTPVTSQASPVHAASSSATSAGGRSRLSMRLSLAAQSLEGHLHLDPLSIIRSLQPKFCETVTAVMLLRQFAGLIVPFQYAAVLAVLKWRRQDLPYNIWLIDRDGFGIEQAFLHLAILFGSAVGVSVVTYVFLRGRNVQVILFLEGVIMCSGWPFYVATVVTSFLWFGSLQLVHNGCDYSLRLEWLNENTQEWIGGFSWT